MKTIRQVMTELERFPKLRCRVEGGRLWVEGDTYSCRKALAKMGFTYIKESKRWYWEADEKPETKPPRFPMRSKKFSQELSDKSSE